MECAFLRIITRNPVHFKAGLLFNHSVISDHALLMRVSEHGQVCTGTIHQQILRTISSTTASNN